MLPRPGTDPHFSRSSRGLARLYQFFPLLLLPVYLALPNRNFYWDGVAFAINIEKQAPLQATLHPNHLLYTPAILWLYRGALLAGWNIRALFLMQGVNSVLACGCVWLFFRMLRRLTDPAAALSGALALAFSATFWRYATDADAYLPSLFLILAAWDLLETERSAAAAGLLHAGAMLFHQLAIFFLPVALFRVREKRPRFVYLCCSILPVALVYLPAYRIVFGHFDARGFLEWITARSPDAAFSFHPLRDLALTVVGTARLFFGGKLAWVRPDVMTITALAALVASLAMLLRSCRIGRNAPLRRPPFFLVLWLAIYASFLFFWMPQNTFYRLFYLPPAIAALWCSLPSRALRWVPAVLFSANLAFLAVPESRVENNPALRFALAQRDRWPPGTPIAFHIFHPDLWTISYFNQQASWIGLEEPDIVLLDRTLEDARRRHQHLWLDSTARDLLAENPDGARWLASHNLQAAPLPYNFYTID